MDKKPSLKKIQWRSLEWWLIAASVAVLALVMVSAYKVRPYTSDDVSTQTAMQAWSKDGSRHVAQSTDTWVLKMPLYAVDNAVFHGNSRHKLFVESLLSSLVLLAGGIFFIKKVILRGVARSPLNLLLAYLPFIWFIAPAVSSSISSYSDVRVLNLMNPNLRNAELGIALAAVALFGGFLGRPVKLSRALAAKAAIAVILAGLFIYNDPYFLYLLVVPGLVTAYLIWLKGRLSTMRALAVGFLGALSFLSYIVIKSLGQWAGMDVINNVARHFVPFDSLWHNLSNLIQGLFNIFGASFWDQNLAPRKLPVLLGLLVLALCVWAVSASGKKLSWGENKEKLILLTIVAANLLVYGLTTTNNSANDRYMVFAVLASTLLLSMMAVGLGNFRVKLSITAVIGASLLLSLAADAGTLVKHRHDNPNAVNYAIINQVKAAGVTKGYAAYWDGNINTYLSSLQLHFLPVICDGHSLLKMNWLVNKPEFNLPAKKTFYLYNATDKSPSVQACTPQLLSATAGITPAQTIPINRDYTLYIYNGDIGNNFTYEHIAAD